MRLSILLSLVLLPVAARAASDEEKLAKTERDAAAFKARTGVAMEWLKGDETKGQVIGEITVYPPTPSDLDDSLTPLVAELSVYPDAFLKAAGLKKIVLARALERSGKPWGGFAFWSGPQQGTLYVGLRSLSHAAVAIHHEVFHLAQHVGSVVAKTGDWRACNPKDFKYYQEGTVDPAAPRVATITDYARTNLLEDEAEVFAWSVSDAAFVDTQASRDDAIACKAKLVRGFAKLVDTTFDDARWSRLRGRRAGEPL